MGSVFKGGFIFSTIEKVKIKEALGNKDTGVQESILDI